MENSKVPKYHELMSPMDATKRKKLEAAGWRVGSASDFLELTEEEAAHVEVGTPSDLARLISKRRRGEAS